MRMTPTPGTLGWALNNSPGKQRRPNARFKSQYNIQTQSLSRFLNGLGQVYFVAAQISGSGEVICWQPRPRPRPPGTYCQLYLLQGKLTSEEFAPKLWTPCMRTRFVPNAQSRARKETRRGPRVNNLAPCGP